MPCRRQDLIISELDAETVVYDPRSELVSALSPAAALVFARCDGTTSYDTVSVEVQPEVLAQALLELDATGLLEGTSRRSALKRAALIGGSALVVTIAAPLMSAAASTITGGGPGTGGTGGATTPAVTVTTGLPTHDTTFTLANPNNCGIRVNATGFPANTPVTLTFSVGTINQNDSGVSQVTATTDSSGSATFTPGDVYNNNSSVATGSGTATVTTTTGPVVTANSAPFPTKPGGTC